MGQESGVTPKLIERIKACAQKMVVLIKKMPKILYRAR